MNSTIKKSIKWGAGVLAALAINSSLYTVNQTQQAVVTQFGKPVSVIVNPVESEKQGASRKEQVEQVRKEIADYVAKEGIQMPRIKEGAGLKFKLPFIESVHYFDRRMLEWDGLPEEIPTKDKKYLFVDSTARLYINNPLIFMATVGGSEERANGKLDDIIDSAVREQISKRDAIESIRSTNRKMEVTDKELEETIKVDPIYEGREKLTSQIADQINQQCKRYGMKVIDLQIKRIVYVEAVKENVENRMIAERTRMQQKYLSEGEGEYQRIMGDKDKELNTIRSVAYKQAETTKGAADAKATKIYADAYGQDPDFYKFVRSLDVLRYNAKGTTLVLDRNNELFQYIGKPVQK